MKINKRIQTRVFMIFGSFTLLLTLVYSAIVFLVAYLIEDDVLEKILAYEAQTIEKVFFESGDIVQPRVDYMQLYFNIEDAPEVITQSYKNDTFPSEIFSPDNVHYHLQPLNLNMKKNPFLVAEVTPFLVVSNASTSFIGLFISMFVAALAIALWLAYRIAAKTTKPITLLANEVSLQQQTQQTVSLSAKHSNDEIGFLAETIESTLNNLKNAIKREGDFNRDVSHELRTPLTVINNTLALAQSRALTSIDVQQLSDSAQQMNHIVTALLTLARAESVIFENIALRALLEDCVISLHSKLVEYDFNITLEINDECCLFANKQLVMLLVNNLIENAISHSATKSLIIRQNAEKLVFENRIEHATPLPPLEKLTEPLIKQTNSDGIGQGLYLVKRIIEALHWQYEIYAYDNCFQFSVDWKNNLER